MIKYKDTYWWILRPKPTPFIVYLISSDHNPQTPKFKYKIARWHGRREHIVELIYAGACWEAGYYTIQRAVRTVEPGFTIHCDDIIRIPTKLLDTKGPLLNAPWREYIPTKP